MLQCLHALEVRMYIDHIMSNKKHVRCGNESAHKDPKLFKFRHFVTSLLIAYDRPRGPSQATRLSKHKHFVSCKKPFSAYGIQTKDHTLNMLECNMASAIIEPVRKKSCSCRGGGGGPILGDVFES